MATLQEIRIVFMGTPDFAVSSLDALLQAGCNIVGVITAPDKPSGRGMKLNESAVKKYALEKGLNILQPDKLKDKTFLQELQSLKADLQIVVAFRMLPEVVWDMPPMGTINLHGSLLPQYRGAAPINWAIINGEDEAGVTTFKLKHEIDTGNILQQAVIPIGKNETAGELHDKMKLTGANLLVKTVAGLADGSLHEKDQDDLANKEHLLKHAPKIFTETCRIEWDNNAGDIHNLIRGLSPIPGAITKLHDKILKVYGSRKEIVNHSFVPGSVHSDGKTFLKYACKDGFIHIQELQLEGKKRMDILSFLRGHKV